ncbi:MAG: hypothetical protein OXB95_04140 [Rhodobacteraceae bacterium]|nr:hypothetical protein [Paracoccaceae bacterium]
MLRKNGKTVGGYNCQTAVDDKHKLIVADEVVQDGNDSGQLEPMMKRAVEVVGNAGVAGCCLPSCFFPAAGKGCELN